MRGTRSALAAAVIAAAGCGAAPVRHQIDIRALEFGPRVVQVAVGDTIVWTNHDLFPHTATVEGAAGWDTGLIPADSTRSAVARRVGVYNYECRVHPTMHGQVVVR